MIKRTLDHWMQILLLCVQNACYESTGLCGICVEPQFLLFDRKYREKNLKRETKMLKWCKKKLNYVQRVQFFRIFRRDMIEMYKIVKGKCDVILLTTI